METLKGSGGDAVKVTPSGEPDTKYQPLLKNEAVVVVCAQRQRQAAKSNTRCCATLKTCGVLILVAIFLINLSGFVVYWCTNLVRDSIIQEMVLRNNSRAYAAWTCQPEKPHLQVRVFNYTNSERFLAGEDDKLRVEEVGPYTYRETMERVNVVFNPNDTVTYQEKRSYEFVPNASAGSLDDVLVVPNMPFLSTASVMKDSNFLVRLSTSALLGHLKVKPFHTLRAEDYFWGYNDSLFEVGKKMSSLVGVGDEPALQKVGLLVTRNGTSHHRITIHTGASNVTLLRVIDRYAGKDSESAWSSDECNRIDGTDGAMFPPHIVREDSVIHIFMKDMCRKFPLVFREHVQAAAGVPAMRFRPPPDVFTTEGSCFCHADSPSCPPVGVFNASPCAYNAPVMYSFPHFYLGDPALQDMVDGLQPEEEKHAMFLDVHPEFGFPVGGESRLQVNMMVRKPSGITNLNRFQDGTILPIVWFEVVVDRLSPEVEADLKTLAFATHTLKFIILVMFLVTLLAVVAVAVQCSRSRCQDNRKKANKLPTVDYVCRKGAIRERNKKACT